MPNRELKHLDKRGLFLAITTLVIGVGGFIWSQLEQYNMTEHAIILALCFVPFSLWLNNPFICNDPPNDDNSNKNLD